VQEESGGHASTLVLIGTIAGPVFVFLGTVVVGWLRARILSGKQKAEEQHLLIEMYQRLDVRRDEWERRRADEDRRKIEALEAAISLRSAERNQKEEALHAAAGELALVSRKACDLERRNADLTAEIDRLRKRVADRADDETVRGTVLGSLGAKVFAGRRVLVVEDVARMRGFLAEVMTSSGAEVRAASTATAAIRTMEEWCPHLIVSDLSLPGMTGLEMIREIRRRPSAKGGAIGAIGISGYEGSRQREEALAAGFDEFLRKPFEPHDLIETVAGILRGSGNLD
jgi:CheY-like chemotaxis protein